MSLGEPPEPTPEQEDDYLRAKGLDAIVDHMVECRGVQAVIASQGPGENLDSTVAEMLAAGWTWAAPTERIGGKRIRYLSPPPETTQEQT